MGREPLIMNYTEKKLPRFRNNLKPGDQISALEWNALASLLNGIKAFDGIWIKATPNGLHIGGGGTGSGVDYSKFAFGFKLASIPGESEEDPGTPGVEITPGTIRFHGAGKWTLAEKATVTLDPMSEPWVYAQMPRGGGTVSIAASSTEPVSNASTFKLPLYLFKRTDGGSYVLHPDLGGIRHIGDVNLDTPLFG